MATEPDPYRTLGLAPTASLAEVKAAYRRLAKANHPDAAGEAALPRFLAIQAAYERLVGPMPGRAKSTDAAPAPAAPKKPWEADADRSDATRRAYGGRARRPGRAPGSSKTGSTTGGTTGSTTGSAKSTRTGPSETAGDAKAGKPPKRATLGSTSYDGVDRETFEPDWAGADWYGTTSGTYWTINPKEYADPRKHGPEYQARARRAAGKRASAEGAEDQPADAGTAIGSDAAPDPEPNPAATTPRHTTSSWWESTSGAAASAREAAPEPPPRAAPRPRPPASAPPQQRQPPDQPIALSPSVSDVWRALAFGLPPSIGWRIARAIVAWIPIGLAIGWASGELTGCGRFSASCDPGTAPIVWVLQVLAFVALLALPVVAGCGVVAAAVCLVAAVPATLFVTASAGAQASRQGTAFLGAVLAIAWIAGVVAAAAIWRRTTRGSTGPVS